MCSDAVSGTNTGSFPGKHIALDAAVIANGDRERISGGFQIVAKTLGDLADHINVHTVRASTENTPESAGTEFQIHVKAVIDLFGIFDRIQIFQFLDKVRCIFG